MGNNISVQKKPAVIPTGHIGQVTWRVYPLKTKFYSYTPMHLKNKLLVLKGIQEDFDKKDITEEIGSLEIQDIKIIKISKIKLGQSENAPTHFLVQLSPDSIPSMLTKHNRIACQRVFWEPYRKNKVFQCKNCQRVGHSSAICRLGYRCTWHYSSSLC